MPKAEISFEIVEHIGVLSTGSKGWTKELNLISWNGREPKYDLREWSPEHDKMGKGVTLSKDELNKCCVMKKTGGIWFRRLFEVSRIKFFSDEIFMEKEL